MVVTETVDIVKNLVSQMALTVKVKAVTDNGNGTYLLDTCNPYYLSPGFSVEIDSVEYLVLSVYGGMVLLQGISPVTATSFVLPAISFFHGTILQTDLELADTEDLFDITPMAYLKRPFGDRFGSGGDMVERRSDISLFFLTQANFAEWMTSDHDKYAVVPMRSLAYAFMKACENNAGIGEIEGFYIMDRIKFGVAIDKGVEKSYWTKNLSGVQLDISLPILKNFKCIC